MKASISLNGILSFINSLSLSAGNKQWLGERLLEEARREMAGEADRTEEMLDKHFGVWKDDRSAEEIIRDLKVGRQSNKLPLNFD